MQILLIIVHVIACLFLIAVILLQAGRGGGLSDMVGGGQTQSILGTETNTFMKRMTEVFAVIFIMTSLAMGIISTHKGKSLMEQQRLAQNVSRRFPIPSSSPKVPAASNETLPSSPVVETKAAAIPVPMASTPVEVKSPAENNTK